MSWLKRFMKLFIDEVEIESGNPPHIPKEPTVDLKKNSTESATKPVRELKTRIAYHYPQKPFSPPSLREKKDRKTFEHHRDHRQRRKEPDRQETAVTVENVKSVSFHAPNEQKNNRPFRPTMIPSPIYGFKRPTEVREKEAVEYELENSFLEGEASIEKNSEPTKNRLYKEDRKKGWMEPVLSEDKQSELFNKERDSVNKERPILEDNEPEVKAASHEELDLDESSIFKKEPSKENRFPSVEKEKTIVGKTDREDVEEHKPAVQKGNAHEEAGQEQRLEPASKQTESIKTRPHLPFNVVMLKKDKRKLEKKNTVDGLNKPGGTHPIHRKNQKVEKINTDNGHQLPDIHFLNPPVEKKTNEEWIQKQIQVLNDTLKNFRVRAKVVNVTQGPSVTRFEVHPEPGVKVSKITNLSDDIKLSLAAKDIRIEAPIPGKHTIGIEVPNKESRPVYLSEIIMSPQFRNSLSPLTIAMGLDISGEAVVADLKKMPHGLIAGATGSGKSVCINSILISLLYKATPEELKLLLIDPKMVELAPYNGIGHLVSPVITDVKAATQALKWAVKEMERRYELFAHTGVRNIERFNQKALQAKEKRMPYIVIVIDELADLMMMSPADVEEAICRIAQKARACGIHLLVATQRPSVDVITGLIKANIPTRIAFSVSSQADSRTILDSGGAEKLLGKGDMLFLDNGTSKTVRLQGSFVSDSEIEKVVSFVKEQWDADYFFVQEELVQKANFLQEEDELFEPACEFVVHHGGASASLLQRHFRIGYNRAARLIEMMEEQGIISEQKPGKPRDVLITEEDFEDLKESSQL